MPHPYHAYNSAYNPVSRQDSELQSLSSDAQTTDDNMSSFTESSSHYSNHYRYRLLLPVYVSTPTRISGGKKAAGRSKLRCFVCFHSETTHIKEFGRITWINKHASRTLAATVSKLYLSHEYDNRPNFSQPQPQSQKQNEP